MVEPFKIMGSPLKSDFLFLPLIQGLRYHLLLKR